MRYAVIDQTTNLVINVILFSSGVWNPPKGTFIIQDNMANIGDIYNPDTKTFTRPELGTELS